MSTRRTHLAKPAEGRGAIPAWIWRTIRDAERIAGADAIPAAIIADGPDRFLVLDVADWNELELRRRDND